MDLWQLTGSSMYRTILDFLLDLCEHGGNCLSVVLDDRAFDGDVFSGDEYFDLRWGASGTVAGGGDLILYSREVGTDEVRVEGFGCVGGTLHSSIQAMAPCRPVTPSRR